jgi:hypothetical protein
MELMASNSYNLRVDTRHSCRPLIQDAAKPERLSSRKSAGPFLLVAWRAAVLCLGADWISFGVGTDRARRPSGRKLRGTDPLGTETRACARGARVMEDDRMGLYQGA